MDIRVNNSYNNTTGNNTGNNTGNHTKAPSESLPEAYAEWLSSVEAAPLNQGKVAPQATLPQAAGDKYKIMETSTKIEKVLKEN